MDNHGNKKIRKVVTFSFVVFSIAAVFALISLKSYSYGQSLNEQTFITKMSILTFFISLALSGFLLKLFFESLSKLSPVSKKVLEVHNFNDNLEKIAKIGCWELDVESQKITWSSGVYKIHGLPLGVETDQIHAINYYAPHEREKITSLLNKSITENLAFDDEFEFIDAKGIHKWVRSMGEPVVNEFGVVKKITGVFQDITNRKKTEIKLGDSKRYLDLAIEGSGIGIWDWYLKDDSVIFNKQWAQMFGLEYNALKMNLESWKERVHPEDIDECFMKFVSYSKGETDIYENVHRVQHEDGSWLHILTRGHFSDWNSKGRPTRFTGVHLDITKMQKLEENQNFILSNSNIGVWKWDIESNELFWGDSMYELYQVDKADFNGAYEAWEHTLEESYKESTVKLLNDAIEGKAEFNTTFAVKTKNKNRLFIGAKAKIERDADGKAIAVSGINWDKTTEYTSKLEVESYIKGLDKYAMVSRIDSNGIIVDANKKFLMSSKFEKEDLIGKSFSIVNSDFHSKEFFEKRWESLQKGETWRGEVKNKAKDGTHFWADTIITPSINKENNNREFLSFKYDITELKEAQLKLTEALNLEIISKAVLSISDTSNTLKDKVELVLDKIEETYKLKKYCSAAIVVKNKDKSVKFYSKRDVESSKSVSFSNLNFDELIKRHNNSNDDFIINNYFIELEKKNKNFHKISLRNSDGDFGFMLIEYTDFDFRSAKVLSLFQEIDRSISDLVRKSFDKEAYNKQKEMALHNSKLASVGELAAGVGHEINNPLAIVKGYLQTIAKRIEQKKLNEEYLIRTIGKMSVASTRIEKIVNGLRTFSRLDGDSTTKFPITQMLEESIAMIKEIYAQEGVRIDFKTSDESEEFWVEGNRGRIQQAVMNLVANAKDATEEIDVRRLVSINVCYEEEQVYISIEDNGVGIEDNVKEQIFDAFFTTKDVNKGTGIGLSLAHSIVSEHGGQLELKSVVNEGSVFKIILPAVSRVRNKRESEVNKEKSVVKESNKKVDLNIMLVDDEEGIRQLIEEILVDDCSSITSFKNGQEALSAYGENPDKYDLIISDMQMPVMDGVTLLERIRKKSIKQPKFLFMTGGVNTDFEDPSSYYNKLIDGYLYKPFTKEQIYQVIKPFDKSKNVNSAA